MEYKIIKPTVINASMMNNTEMILQFIEMYLQQCPTDFEKLHSAIDNGNFHTIRDLAHHIKPTMEYIGASDLRILFQKIEDASKEHVDIHLIVEQFNILKKEFELLLQELKHYRDHL